MENVVDERLVKCFQFLLDPECNISDDTMLEHLLEKLEINIVTVGQKEYHENTLIDMSVVRNFLKSSANLLVDLKSSTATFIIKLAGLVAKHQCYKMYFIELENDQLFTDIFRRAREPSSWSSASIRYSYYEALKGMIGEYSAKFMQQNDILKVAFAGFSDSSLFVSRSAEELYTHLLTFYHNHKARTQYSTGLSRLTQTIVHQDISHEAIDHCLGVLSTLARSSTIVMEDNPGFTDGLRKLLHVMEPHRVHLAIQVYSSNMCCVRCDNIKEDVVILTKNNSLSAVFKLCGAFLMNINTMDDLHQFLMSHLKCPILYYLCRDDVMSDDVTNHMMSYLANLSPLHMFKLLSQEVRVICQLQSKTVRHQVTPLLYDLGSKLCELAQTEYTSEARKLFIQVTNGLKELLLKDSSASEHKDGCDKIQRCFLNKLNHHSAEILEITTILNCLSAMHSSSTCSSTTTGTCHSTEDKGLLSDLSTCIQRHLCDTRWEVRDSTLNYLKTLCSEKHLDPVISNWLTQYGFPGLIWDARLDAEGYVRASAIEAMNAMIGHPPLTDHLLIQRKLTMTSLIKETLDIILTDTEAFPRRAALDFIIKLRQCDHTKDIFTNNFKIICSCMREAVLDFDWEVKMKVLMFWEILSNFGKDTTTNNDTVSSNTMLPFTILNRYKSLLENGLAEIILAACDDEDPKVNTQAHMLLQFVKTDLLLVHAVCNCESSENCVDGLELSDKMKKDIDKIVGHDSPHTDGGYSTEYGLIAVLDDILATKRHVTDDEGDVDNTVIDCY